tara:strand:+ start:273 stop:407 length:135 start_codon:yes stop_codon:yes gene_type:complete
MAQKQQHQLLFERKKIKDQVITIEKQRKAIEEIIKQQKDKRHNQ